MNIKLYLLLSILIAGPYGCYSLYMNYALSKSISRMDIDNATGLVRGIAPFEFKKGEKGVLLIHGYTGTSQEMFPLGKYLEEREIGSYGIVLPGHGSTPRKLKKTTKEDWYKATEEALLKMKKEYRSVYIAGFSLGSAIAMRLAANHEVNGIALLSPAVFLKRRRPTSFQLRARLSSSIFFCFIPM